MHELSIARALCESIVQALRDNGGRRAVSAQIQIGVLTGVAPEALVQAFGPTAAVTAAAGCRLIIQRVPLTVSCRVCGWRGVVSPGAIRCVRCGQQQLSVKAGRELKLVSIEISDDGEEGPHASGNY